MSSTNKKNKFWVKSVFSEIDDSTPTKSKEIKVEKSQNASYSQPAFPTHDAHHTPKASSSQQQQQPKPKPLIPTNVHSSDWIKNFSPQSVDDLAVHAKKMSELQDWFHHVEAIRQNHPAQICLITGPAGAGKTACLEVMARDMNYNITEWINPLDVEISSQFGETGDDNQFMESHVELFKRFLFRSSRYKSLFEKSNKSLVLIEDFPNAFIRKSDGFVEILQDYKQYGKSPLVFIVTDSRSKQLNISYNLFPDHVKESIGINHICFNAVATTLMKKALKRIQTLMSAESFRNVYKSPTQDIVDSIGLAAQGDLRNAVINLHFGSLMGAPKLSTEVQKNSTTRKRSAMQKKLTSIGKDESITMMHSLGRVFNPKFEEDKLPPTFLHSPEAIADQFSSECKNFVSFVHANYLGHFGDVENVVIASENISLSDILMGEYREAQLGVLGLNTAVRGVMVSNTRPVSGWMPVRGPKRLNYQQNFQAELYKLGLRKEISAKLLSSDYRTYVKIIRGQNDAMIT